MCGPRARGRWGVAAVVGAGRACVGLCLGQRSQRSWVLLPVVVVVVALCLVERVEVDERLLLQCSQNREQAAKHEMLIVPG